MFAKIYPTLAKHSRLITLAKLAKIACNSLSLPDARIPNFTKLAKLTSHDYDNFVFDTCQNRIRKQNLRASTHNLKIAQIQLIN
jgi:hypothetical protein